MLIYLELNVWNSEIYESLNALIGKLGHLVAIFAFIL